MSELKQPSEIAREVLRRLTQQRIAPTPDNYLALYHEIAGTIAADVFPEKALKSLALALPRTSVEQQRFARQIDTAVNEKNWDALRAALVDMFNKAGAQPPNWSALIRDLLTQMENRQSGLTPTMKRDSIEHVLQASSAPDMLFTRLHSLLRSWAQQPVFDAATQGLVEAEAAADVSADPAKAVASEPVAVVPTKAAARMIDGELKEIVAQLIENGFGMLLADTPDILEAAKSLAADVRAVRNEKDIAALATKLKKFSYRLQFVAEDQAEIKTALQHLLQLIIENINELVLDDRWLNGQISVVLDIFQGPLDLRRLDDVERRMKEVIFKQGALKKQLNEARDRLKNMLATFVDRLADFSESTSGYHDKIEVCAQKISTANDIGELSDVLDEVMRETRVIQLNAQRSRDELQLMRSRAEEADKEITRLQQELAHTSEMVTHDPLTGALNRKGMDEALEREVSHARRQSSSLCLSLLDVDNFKNLNDTLGHQAGDDALVHLSKVVRETLRPQDTLARYGGEEFVIMLPDTPVEAAVAVLTRVQRELTKRYFLHDNNKVLITFSAGVAQLAAEEDPHDAIKRADAAMYIAKRAGKNRVVVG